MMDRGVSAGMPPHQAAGEYHRRCGSRPAMRSMLLVLIVFFLMTAQAEAVIVSKISLDRPYITTNPKKATYVTGTISKAKGQKIVLLSSSKKALASVIAPRTGKKARFRIRVPLRQLAAGSTVTFYVKAKASGGAAASRAVSLKIRCVKLSAGIAGASKITKGTLSKPFPVGASSAAGRLTYRSSRPKVATVSSKGIVTPKKKGKTVITVYRKENSVYKAAVKTVRVTIRRPTAEEGRAAAVAWAKKIAKDDRFTYGGGSIAHHNGCYFCGTNGGKVRRARGTRWSGGYNGKSWKRTYCCNPFVHAAYAHGAKVPSMLKACRQMNAVDMTRSSYYSKGCFRGLGKPAFSKLIPGDIFVSGSHVWLYCGGDKLAEATSFGGGKKAWSKDSIRVTKGAKRRYSQCRFVMRFTGY